MSKYRITYWTQESLEVDTDTDEWTEDEINAFDAGDISTWPEHVMDAMVMGPSAYLYDWEIDEL